MPNLATAAIPGAPIHVLAVPLTFIPPVPPLVPNSPDPHGFQSTQGQQGLQSPQVGGIPQIGIVPPIIPAVDPLGTTNIRQNFHFSPFLPLND